MDDPFTTLGIEPRYRLDVRQLEQRHRDLSRALHPDRHASGSPAERRLAIEKAAAVNEAFRTLKNPETRAAALLSLAGRHVEENTRADPALLAEILDRREALEEARALGAGRAERVAQLRNDIDARVQRAEQTIAEVFDTGAVRSERVEAAYAALIELRYLYRFLQEAEAMVNEDGD